MYMWEPLDPIVPKKDTLEIITLGSTIPNMGLQNTNAGARDEAWWTELGSIP